MVFHFIMSYVAGAAVNSVCVLCEAQCADHMCVRERYFIVMLVDVFGYVDGVIGDGCIRADGAGCSVVGC